MRRIRDQIAALQRVAPRASNYGQLYSRASELKRKFQRVRMYALFVSDDGEMMFKDHLFETHEARSGAQWAEWFSRPVDAASAKKYGRATPHNDERMLEYIQRTSVLPGMFNKTGQKHWAVLRLVGWRGDTGTLTKNERYVMKGRDTNAKHKSGSSAVGIKRNKTQRKGK